MIAHLFVLLVSLLLHLRPAPVAGPAAHPSPAAMVPATSAALPSETGPAGPAGDRLPGRVADVATPPPPAAPAPGTYVGPGEWLDTPIPDDVQPQLPDETLGRAYG